MGSFFKGLVKKNLVLRFPARLLIAMGFYAPKLSLIPKWSAKKTEFSNFYYEISDKNLLELEFFCSSVSEVPPSEISGYLHEINSNEVLREQLNSRLQRDSDLRDVQIGFGRRAGWYALVRALKPRLVVETGVHHGIGAAVLLEALGRNNLEGFDGRYLGIDIDPFAGKGLGDIDPKVGKLIVGDSITELKKIAGPIDIFISDSDHSPNYERNEFEIVLKKMGADSIIISDNSHASSELAKFSKAQNRLFHIFREEPVDHWYPGGGIGVSLRSHRRRTKPDKRGFSSSNN